MFIYLGTEVTRRISRPKILQEDSREDTGRQSARLHPPNWGNMTPMANTTATFQRSIAAMTSDYSQMLSVLPAKTMKM